MRNVDINSYWAEIVRDTEQFGQIAVAENPEFNRIAGCIFQVLEDSFIKTGSEYAVERWETMLQLAPSAGDTLETRKARILTYLNTQTPYTVRILNQLIKGVVGDDDYGFEYNNDTQTLTISISPEFETTVRDLVSRVIPMNLTVEYDFSMLPAGYLEAAFLESTGYQCLLPFVVLRTQTIVCTVQIISATGKILGYFQKNADNATRALSYETYNDSLLRLCVDGSYPVLLRSDLHIKRTVTFEPMSNNKINVFSSDFSSTQNFDQTFVVTNQIGIFVNNGDGGATSGRMWNFEVYDESKQIIHNLVPVIDNNGVACAYDMVDKTTHYNKGSKAFVIGLTREQAVKLAKLPASDGTLTISLPSSIVSGSTVTDSAVNAALTTARSKGWNITVQTYTEEATATASTFGMQRIWVRKTQDANGSYVDADGNRWQVDWCVTMYTPDNSTPDMHGYELFRSVEAATEYWELTQYVDPNAEQELLTEGE